MHLFGALVTMVWVVCMLLSTAAVAQQEKDPWLEDFRGTASVTNNGISLVPSFSLGDPALLFDVKFFKGRFSFEPDMRFALEGKPWSFLFWFRYKAVQKGRFSLRVGAHPALNFRTVEVVRNGEPESMLESRRYVAGEIAPSYAFSKKISIGLYYLYGYGFDAGVTNTNFLVLNMDFKHLDIAKGFYFNISPQCYYLRSDDQNGYYAVAFISLLKEGFPLSVSTILNKALYTEILPEQDFTWNVSLVFRFPKKQNF